MPKLDSVDVGIVGYGPRFNMGSHHAGYIEQIPDMQVVAVCDLDEKQLEAAKEELPDIETYLDVSTMLEDSEPDLAIIITPHNTHAKLAVECLEAGTHVIVEKPMCLSVDEANTMITAAEGNDVMLSVYHNRRWDADYLTICEVVDQGLIGEVFEVEVFKGNWQAPRGWWRDVKKISGGAFFDWGAHMIDWVLQLVDLPIVDVTGFFHKRVWDEKTNEDQVRAIIRFEENVQADVTLSSISHVNRSKWRISGECGGIEAQWGADEITVACEMGDLSPTMTIPLLPDQRQKYYQNIAAHLMEDEPLSVTPESAARAIGVMEAAERSAESGRAEGVGI